jgi:hypothetical protein
MWTLHQDDERPVPESTTDEQAIGLTAAVLSDGVEATRGAAVAPLVEGASPCR